MSFTVHCPKCSMGLTASEADIGKQGKCSSCGTVFSIEMPYASSPPPAAPPPLAGSPEWSDVTPGTIRVGEGISRGFAVLHSNLGTFLLIGLVFLALQGAVVLVSMVPCVGSILSLISSFVIQPALGCGFYRACLKQHDGAESQVSDLFAEFEQWVQFLLLVLVQAAITIGIMLPGGIVVLVAFVPVFQGQQQPNLPVLIVGIAVCFVCAIGLGLALMFTLPALTDRRQGFWDAITTSWRLMASNPLGALGATILAGLVGMLGFLACCVGLIYALPAVHCMIAAIYRTAMPPRSWPDGMTASPTPAWGMQPPGPPPPMAGPPSPLSGGA